MLRATALCVLILPCIASAADWPSFRGPKGDGIAGTQTLPTEWSSTRNVLWKQPIPGQGWSSPIVSDGKIYLTAAVPSGENYSLRLIALDEATGSSMYDVEIFKEQGPTPIHSKNSHASPTPLLSGNRIYTHFGHEGTACLDLNGKVLWQNRDLKYPPRHGAGGTPIIVDNRLIFSCDGDLDPFIVALDIDSGKVLWKTPRDTSATKKFSFSTATLLQVDGQDQVVSAGSDMVCALDPRDGREIWRVRYDGYSVIPKPVVGNGMIYVCTGYNTPSLIAIRTGGKGDVTESHVAWTVKRGVPHTASVIVAGKELFMVSDNGVASCVDATTGETAWQERLGGGFSASPIMAGGMIYFCNEEGTTTVVKASRQFTKVAENSIGERTLASFAVAGNTLLIRGDKHLYCIARK